MNEKWVIKSLLRVLPDTVLRVAFEYIFCCCEQQHDGDYVTNKNRSVKPIIISGKFKQALNVKFSNFDLSLPH